MITVCLNEANFEYDIHSLVKAFYPAEDVKVSADPAKIRELEEEQAPLFRLEVSYVKREDDGRNDAGIWQETDDGWEEAGIREEKSGGCTDKIAFHLSGSFVEDTAETLADFSNRADTKNRLKKCLYRMLSRHTDKTLPWGTLTGIRPTKIPMSMLEQGKAQAEIQAYMRENYLTSEQKIDLSIEIAKRELALLGQIDYSDGYSLYIGIPFCPSICSYCSFSSSPIGIWESQVDAYLDALEREIAFTAKTCGHKKLNTIYIGGGTPTTLMPKQLDRLLSKIEDSFDFSHLLEYTVEAGRPDSITREKLVVLRKHGISRISINPQTMKQETLDLIGRRHTVAQTIESFHLARELGFDNINMDLIVGLPGEELDDVRHTMEEICKLSPDNLTVHSLAIKRAAKFRMFPEDYAGMRMENNWEIIELTAKYAREQGLLPYYLYRQKNMAGNFENVGYAAEGKAGLYNILIMEEKQTILALGAGSISKRVEPGRKIVRCENVKDVAQYIARVDEMIERKRQLLGEDDINIQLV